MEKNITKIFVGVDIAKKHLDIHFNPINKDFRINNNAEGILKLKNELKKFEVDKVVCESSGGYERPMIRELQAIGYRTWVVEGSRIHAFIKSEGVRSKTDKQDAMLIARFAAQKNPKKEAYKSSNHEFQLRELVRRKNDLTMMGSAEKTRLKQSYDAYIQNSITRHLEFIGNELENIASQIKLLIEEDVKLKERFDLAVSVPGVGIATASAMIAELPELGSATKQQIAALTGLAPYTRESGSYKGKSYISQGRFAIRKAIYMAALTASRCNPIFSEFYKKLRAAGKAPKVAIIAVARKLVIAVNAMLRNNQVWRTA